MAGTATEQGRRVGRALSVAGVVFVLIMALNMVVENLVYVRSRRVYDSNMEAVQNMSAMNTELASVNERVVLMAAGMSDEQTLEEIDKSFENIHALKQTFLAGEAYSDVELRRFMQASYAIQGFERKIEEVRDTLPTAGYAKARDIYEQEISPLKACASEMLEATIEIGQTNAEANVHNSTIMHGIAQLILILITVLVLVAMTIFGRRQIRALYQIQEKEKELAAAEGRINRTRQKVFDAASMNILTNMQNRYGLETRLEELLEEGQFYVGVFDIDNFREINDTYGYNFGDECLAAIADRLRTAYGDQTELFNVAADEFCVILDNTLSDMQAQQLAEEVRQSIGSPIVIDGVVIQNTVSASLCHVLPSGLDVTELLMRLDSAMHAAKRDGGNRLNYIR